MTTETHLKFLVSSKIQHNIHASINNKMIALIVIAVLIAFYFYCTKNNDYWKKRGVKHDTPIPIFGNNFAYYIQKKGIVDLASEMYNKYPNEKVVGFFRATLPELVIRDPDIIKRILITDFAVFYSRGQNTSEVVEPLMKNLFFADGDLWKMLRQRLTPTFTSGKLKAMFPLITERAEKLNSRAMVAAESNKPIDVRDLMARYNTDFIGACGFGLDADSLSDENSAFRKFGAKIFDYDTMQIIITMLKEAFPNMFKSLKFMGKLEKDLFEIVNHILEQRNHMPSGRNDFIDLLLECKNKGKVVGESIEKRKEDGSPVQVELEFDDMIIASQVFIFFAAGFETSSSATSFTLYQLAFYPEEQRKIQEEIDVVLEKYGGLTYDAVKEMTYLECAFKEALRLFPSVGIFMRESKHDYTIPEIGVSITPGVRIVIPVQALHKDPKYFEDPEVFKPERFLPENIDTKNKYVYLPFGEGPRSCIGRGSWLVDGEVVAVTEGAGPAFGSRQRTSVVVAVGQSAVLDCKVLRLGDKAVSWIRSRDLNILSHAGAVFTADSRVSATETRGTTVSRHSLRIDSLRASDAGRYECQVNTEPKLSLFFNLTVLDEPVPKTVVTVDGPRVHRVTPGGTTTMTCEAKYDPPPRALLLPPLDIRWLKGESLLNLQSVRGGISLNTERWPGRATSKLTLADLGADDEGEYSCSVGDQTALFHIVITNDGPVEAMQRDQSSLARDAAQLHLSNFSVITILFIVLKLLNT